MRRMPVEALGPVGARLRLDPEWSHHTLRVLRLARGAELLLFDGTGRQAPGRLVDAQEGRAVVEVTGEPVLAAPRWPLHVVLGVCKGPATDLALRMVTEAGATDVHLVPMERSVARGDRLERWERIVVSAAQQCGRADVPRVRTHADLAHCLEGLPELDLRVALPGAEPIGSATGPAGVCVGPEGGLTEAEVRLCLDRGARPMSLGRWILRADTAAAVATALTAPVSW